MKRARRLRLPKRFDDLTAVFLVILGIPPGETLRHSPQHE